MRATPVQSPSSPAASSAAGANERLARRLADWKGSTKIPLKAMACDLGVSIATCDSWVRGTRFPSGGHLDSLSRYTGIPLPCLLCDGHVPCMCRTWLLCKPC